MDVHRHDDLNECFLYVNKKIIRGNNNIGLLCTPPPHISSFEEILPRHIRHILVQLSTKYPFLKSYLHKVNAKSHPSPLCTLCNTHTHDTHHLFNCTHIRTTLSPLDLWTDPTGVIELLGISWLVAQKRDDRTHPTNKGQGSG